MKDSIIIRANGGLGVRNTVFQTEWFNTYSLQLLLWITSQALTEGTEIDGIIIPKGCYVGGRIKTAAQMGINTKTVLAGFGRLCAAGMIAVYKVGRGLSVTLIRDLVTEDVWQRAANRSLWTCYSRKLYDGIRND